MAEELKDWNVTVRCVVIKTVYCPQCTEADIRADLWSMADDEQEVSQEDWEIQHVSEVPE